MSFPQDKRRFWAFRMSHFSNGRGKKYRKNVHLITVNSLKTEAFCDILKNNILESCSMCWFPLFRVKQGVPLTAIE